jgi:hypothetical protein
MKQRAFLDSSVDELVAQLTVDEKIKLLSAPNWWNTTREYSGYRERLMQLT